MPVLLPPPPLPSSLPSLPPLPPLPSSRRSVLLEHEAWRLQSWLALNCPDLLLAVDKQVGVVSSVPCHAHQWDVYVQLVEAIGVVRTTIPLVEGLRSPAMRPRHWKQVLRLAAGTHLVGLGRGGSAQPAALQALSFGQLLDLGLHGEATPPAM